MSIVTQRSSKHRSIVARVLRRSGALLTAPLRRASRNTLGVISRVDTAEAALALTFDDGPDPRQTPAALEILARHGARATFFMVGELAMRYPDIVRAAAAAGHAVANHSWSHLSFPMMTGGEQYRQLRRCEEALAPYGEKLFRPPYFHQSVGSRWRARRAGYEVVGYSAHAEDWLPRSAEWMAARLVRSARPGAIVILHDNIYRNALADGCPDRAPMLGALDRALRELKGSFRFVTVPELLRLGKAVRENRFQQGTPEMRPALQLALAEARGQEKQLAASAQP